MFLVVETGVQLDFRRLFPEHDFIIHDQIWRMTYAEFLNKVGVIFRETHPVHASVISYDTFVELQVSNQGPGIPAKHIERVFDRFYRINSRRRSDTGSGLGLAIVKSIMQLHGGQVSVESKVNKLSTFTLHFPKAKPAKSS